MKKSTGLSSSSLPSRRAGQSQASAATRLSLTAAARAAALRAHLAALEGSNHQEDASIGLQLDAGLYVEGGGSRGGGRKSLGGGAGKKGGGSGASGSGASGGAPRRSGPWVRPNRLRRLPEVLCVELGAVTGEGGRPVAECLGMPTLEHARAALGALASGGAAAAASSAGTGSAGASAALGAGEAALRFLAASALLPARYPARRFCAVCGAPGRYALPGGVEHVCSLPCKSSYLETQRGGR